MEHKIVLKGLIITVAVLLINSLYDNNIKGVKESGIHALHIDKQPSKLMLVPKDFKTIQSAIDAATPGSIVFVDGGTYQENLKVNKSVHLKSHSAILESDPRKAAVHFEDAGTVTLEGFNIHPLGPIGSIGILIEGKTTALINSNELSEWAKSIYVKSRANAEIQNNLVNASFSSESLSGIFIENSQSRITSNKVFVSSSLEYLSGILVYNSEVSITSNDIYVLQGSREGAAAIFLNNSRSDINSNRLYSQKSEGIVIHGSRGTVLEGNVITALDSVGIVMARPGNEWEAKLIIIKKNYLTGAGQSKGAGIAVNDLEAEIMINSISGFKSGVFFGFEGRGRLEDNLITGNQDGVVISREAVAIVLNKNQILRNNDCGIRIEDTQPDKEKPQSLQGQGNLIITNSHDNLCPSNFPWPPGFLKP